MCLLIFPLFFLPWLRLVASRVDLSSACNQSSSDGETVYTCRVADTAFKLKASENDYANIWCQKGSFDCAIMPSFPIGNNDTLSSLSIFSCSLPTHLSCVTSRLNATGARTLLLRDSENELTAEHLAGLRDLQALHMLGAAAQKKVPFDALPNLPLLQDLRIHDAHLTLETPSSSKPSSLTTLMLFACSIDHVPAGAFRTLGNLTDLYLNANNISDIDGGAFEGLGKLKMIDLSRNPLIELRSDMFSSTPSLKNIVLVGTGLRTVRKSTFRFLKYLEQITFSLGEATLAFEDRALADVPSLTSLTISNNILSSIPPALIAGSKALKQLFISKSQVYEIPRNFFRDQQKLEILDLQENSIKVLNTDVFWPLKNLKELDLRNNLIEVLPARIFVGLKNLLKIHIDHNELKTIAADAFLGPRNLQILTLSHNHLSLKETPSDINTSPFMDLKELQELDLSFNDISVVFDDWRLSLIHKIRKINLSSNKIRILRKTDTDFHGKNVVVDLSRNQIKSIEIGENLRNRTATIILEENPFECDCKLYPFLEYIEKYHQPNYVIHSPFCNQPNPQNASLQTLNLNDLSCVITTCPESCSCKTIPRYSIIDLDCSKPPRFFFEPAKFNVSFTKLKLQSLEGPLLLPSHVTSLNLSGIGLTEIPTVPANLKEIDLSFNNIHVLTDNILKTNASLYLKSNPLDCDCTNIHFLKELLVQKHRIKDRDTVTCSGGEALFSIDIGHLCDVWLAGIAGGTLAVIGLVVIIIVAGLVCYNATLIRKYLYLQGCSKFVYEEEIDGKDYDIYLSYSDDDEKLIAQQVLPRLESQGFKVCVRYRDWLAGDWIPGKIAESVKNSRRVVVLISQSYLESLAVLELKASKSLESKEKMKRTIIIMKEDIKLDAVKVDPILEDVLAKKHNKWEDSEHFWRRLRKMLPKRRSEKCQKLTQGALNVALSPEGKVQFLYKKIDHT